MLGSFLLILTSIFLIYAFGIIITGLSSIHIYDGFTSLLVKMITGLVALIFIYSVIKSGGNTTNLLMPIPFFLFMFFLKQESKKSNAETVHWLSSIKNELQPLTFILCCAVTWFVWQYSLFIVNINGDPVYAPLCDSVFYSDIINSLKNGGHENFHTIKNELLNIPEVRTPYHYFELWLSAFISSVYGIRSLTVFLLITPVLFFTLNSLLICAIARHFKLNSIVCFLSPLLLFFIPFIIQYPVISDMLPGKFISYLNNYIYSYTSLLKFQVYMFFILGAVYFYLKYSSAFIFFVLLLPFATFTSIPSVVGLATAYLFYKFLNRNVDRNFWLAVLSVIIIVAFLGFYYRDSFLSQSEHVSAGSAESGYTRTIINIAGGTILQFIYIYGPYFVLLMAVAWGTGVLPQLYSKLNSRLYISFIIAFLFGIAGWSTIHRELDSHQFFSNFFISSMIVLFIFQVLQIMSALKRQSFWLRTVFSSVIIIFIGYCMIWNYGNHAELVNGRRPYSRSFYDQVSGILDTLDNTKTGVCFYSSEDYKRNPAVTNSVVEWPGQVFKMMYDKFYVISLSDLLQSYDHQNKIDRRRNEALKQNSVFAKWLESKKVTDIAALSNMSKWQLSFIRENKIRFAFASPGAVMPAEIVAVKEKEISDQVSGFRFMTFKQIE